MAATEARATISASQNFWSEKQRGWEAQLSSATKDAAMDESCLPVDVRERFHTWHDIAKLEEWLQMAKAVATEMIKLGATILRTPDDHRKFSVRIAALENLRVFVDTMETHDRCWQLKSAASFSLRQLRPPDADFARDVALLAFALSAASLDDYQSVNRAHLRAWDNRQALATHLEEMERTLGPNPRTFKHAPFDIAAARPRQDERARACAPELERLLAAAGVAYAHPAHSLGTTRPCPHPRGSVWSPGHILELQSIATAHGRQEAARVIAAAYKIAHRAQFGVESESESESERRRAVAETSERIERLKQQQFRELLWNSVRIRVDPAETLTITNTVKKLLLHFSSSSSI
ncbi:MAG: hypothetical protein ACTSX8_02740 [Alphaproteobacteria bacterium]